jgi:tetratricopeptide (TPR) repeat protein
MNKVFKEGPRQDKRLKMAKKIAMVLIPIIVVASIGLIVRNVKKKNLEKDAITYEQDGDKNLKDKFYDKAEEAYASAVKAVKSINGKESLERVERKHSILKKILEGDEQYDKQNFENAKVSYTDAMGNLKFFSQYDNNVFNKEDLYITIDKKIKNTKNCLDVKDQFGKGNKLFDDGKFKESLPVYEAALKKAEDIYYDEMTDKLEKKIEEVKKKLEKDEATAAGQAKDKKLLEDFIKEVKDKWKDAEDFVKQAKSYETKEYEKAIGRYEKAIEKCKEIVELPNNPDYKEVKDKKEVKELKELIEAKKKQIEYEDKIIDLNNKKDAEKAKKAG